jgi:hypothetical protein
MQLSMSKLIVCRLPKKIFAIPRQSGCFDKFFHAKTTFLTGIAPVYSFQQPGSSGQQFTTAA